MESQIGTGLSLTSTRLNSARPTTFRSPTGPTRERRTSGAPRRSARGGTHDLTIAAGAWPERSRSVRSPGRTLPRIATASPGPTRSSDSKRSAPASSVSRAGSRVRQGTSPAWPAAVSSIWLPKSRSPGSVPRMAARPSARAVSRKGSSALSPGRSGVRSRLVAVTSAWSGPLNASGATPRALRPRARLSSQRHCLPSRANPRLPFPTSSSRNTVPVSVTSPSRLGSGHFPAPFTRRTAAPLAPAAASGGIMATSSFTGKTEKRYRPSVSMAPSAWMGTPPRRAVSRGTVSSDPLKASAARSASNRSPPIRNSRIST